MKPKRDRGRDMTQLFIERWLLGRRLDLVDALDPCESPMEALLCTALLCAEDAGGPFLRLCLPGGPPGLLAAGRAGEMRLQHPVELPDRRIRIDVAIVGAKKLAIEVDGAEFHHATAAQAERDRTRDTLLAAAGWTPVRFTGSEINADPARCAAAAMRLLGLEVGVPAPAELAAAAAPRERDALAEEIAAAEARGDTAAVDALLRQSMERAKRKRGAS